jgi:ornithine cyclodeaminase/alanine dehydrogenase-like protein (mu-crystallin family)
MLHISADDVDGALTFGSLVETLRQAFRAGAVQPVRHHHTVERPDGAASTLLLMPAWTDLNAAGTSAGGVMSESRLSPFHPTTMRSAGLLSWAFICCSTA